MSGERMTDAALADAIKRACQYYKQAGRVASTSQMLAKQHESTADKIIASALRARPQAVAEVHSDDVAIDRFASAMKEKMKQKRAQGRYGWDDASVCSIALLQDLLNGHVAKGDPIDVGNISMMLFNRGAKTTHLEVAQVPKEFVTAKVKSIDVLFAASQSATGGAA